MATMDEEGSEEPNTSSPLSPLGKPKKVKSSRLKGMRRSQKANAVTTRLTDLSDPLLGDEQADAMDLMFDEEQGQKAEPLLEQVCGIVDRLDSKQQVRYQQLLTKINGIEENISKAMELWSPVGSVGDGCFTAPKLSPADDGDAATRSRPRRSRLTKTGASASPDTIGRKNDCGTLFVKVSVQEPGDPAWRCPTEMSAVPVAGRRDSIKSRDPAKLQACAGKITVHLLNARDLKNSDALGKSDPYCVCAIGSGRVIQEQFHTKVVNETLEPGWNQSKVFQTFNVGDTLHFSVKDKDIHSDGNQRDEVLGVCSLAFDQFFPDGFFGALQLTDSLNGCLALDDAADQQLPCRSVTKVLDQLKESECLAFRQQSSGYLQKYSKDTTLDIIVAGIIALNAVTIGISIDHEYDAFVVIDLLFTLCFIVEMILKINILTLWGYFSSPWHILDFSIIVVDILQLILSAFIDSSVRNSTPPAALFRMLRLVRLLRVLRLVNLGFLEDLIAMISGIMGGASTLLWAIVIYIIIIYITSVMFREFFGRKAFIMSCEECGDVDITEYFASVPRSMLTVFRFFFGDFTTVQGVNIYEGIQDAYGTVAEGFVCIVFFVVSIGVFNVITAIFVESTLAAAQHLENSRQVARLNDPDLWSSNMSILIRKLFEKHGMPLEDAEPISESVRELANEPIVEEEFEEFIKDKEVVQALDNLEIDGADHQYLFDILDADNTGSLSLIELMDGLRRLRGSPRRSDIITIDLMVREMQENLHLVVESINNVLEMSASAARAESRPHLAPSRSKSALSSN